MSLYFDLTDAAKTEYLVNKGNGIIKTENNVTVVSNQTNNGLNIPYVVSEYSNDAPYIENILVDKSGTYTYNADEPAEITYTVKVNPNAAPLVDTAIIDTLPAGLTLISGSVELKDLDGIQVTLDTNNLSIAVDPVTGETVMTVELPDAAQGYILTYTTVILEPIDGSSIQNNAELRSGSQSFSGDTSEIAVSNDMWGYLGKRVNVTILKHDFSGGPGLRLAGITFALYKKSDLAVPLKTKITNAQGIVTFYGLEPGTEYIIKETATLDDYILRTDEIEIMKVDAGNYSMNVANERKTEPSGILFEKEFLGTEANTIDPAPVYTSEFTLKIYPNSSNPGYSQPVMLKLISDGLYVYTTVSSENAGVIIPNTTDGTVTINGLPWGKYGLIEKTATEGYAVYKTEKNFTITYSDSQDPQMIISYDANFNDDQTTGSDNTIFNYKTEIKIKKMYDDGNTYVVGAKLAIYDQSSRHS